MRQDSAAGVFGILTGPAWQMIRDAQPRIRYGLTEGQWPGLMVIVCFKMTAFMHAQVHVHAY